MGNLLSVRRAFEKVGATVEFVNTPDKILSSKKLVLPGVGAFAQGMQSLEQLNIVGAIRDFAANNQPLLGICLGMQLLLDSSEEYGFCEGLKIISGNVVPIENYDIDGKAQKVPIIGWYELVNNSNNESILSNVPEKTRMYFVHSYMASNVDQVYRLADIHYGGRNVIAAIGKDNVIGLQFHPEKSGEYGLDILRDFVGL